ncbi:putative E3 ubiquitin-protein ligase MARCHF10 isoform X3 [Phascolarctos cinereus]|uniref:RING-type E3 ubiquitin transferase n=1 Tax=Phascolarctos cinereus TaxID=38626 RepID=A0A6P5L4P6_PHACI|nr:probable E3 ubiquitin-protein ligase MARCH10 isoform X3 [Phascolarctos cinereus]
MMHEARDRQKFVNDAQYLRDMQHKVDSEYQACLRRQEKKRDQFCRQESSFERPRPSCISSSRQNSAEDLGPEQRATIKASVTKSESKLPAIDQTPVKQKQKVTTCSSKKPEKNVGGTSKPAPHSVMQQDVWSNDSKMKRQTRERRNFVPSSQLNVDQKTPEKVSKDWTVLSPSQPSLPVSSSFQGANGSQTLGESIVPSLTSTSTVQPRRASVRFRDEDFYSFLELNTVNTIEGNEDAEDIAHLEEEFLLAGIQPPYSFNSKNIGFSRIIGTQVENQNSEQDLENSRPSPLKRNEAAHCPLRKSNLMDSALEQSLLGQRLPRDHKIPDGDSTKENDCIDDEGEKTSFNSWGMKGENRQNSCFNIETLPNDCSFVETRPGNHTYNRDRQSYGNSPRNSFDCFPPNRSAAHRPLLNSSYNTPRSLLHSAQRAEVQANLSLTSVVLQGSDAEGNSRFNVHRPLSPIRSRNRSITSENQDTSSPVANESAFCVKEIEDKNLTSQPPEALLSEDVLQNSQDGSSSVDPPSSPPLRMNFRGHLHMSEPIQEEIPFTFFAVSDLPSQIEAGNRMAASNSTNAKESHQTKADPDKLKKLQESLLEEDSEEEGDLCRICQITGGSPTNPLMEPCGCVGSLQFVHQECLKKWLKVKITSGAELGAVKTCEMCKQGLIIDLDDFNVNDYYRKHQQSRAQNELMNSGLYLVLLLHLYEQRFAELMRLNYNRVARERIRIQETVMKTVYSKATAGSSNEEGGRGAQCQWGSPLPSYLLCAPHVCLLSSFLLKQKPMSMQFTFVLYTHLFLGSGLSILKQQHQLTLTLEYHGAEQLVVSYLLIISSSCPVSPSSNSLHIVGTAQTTPRCSAVTF